VCVWCVASDSRDLGPLPHALLYKEGWAGRLQQQEQECICWEVVGGDDAWQGQERVVAALAVLNQKNLRGVSSELPAADQQT
jgi:hypothetical protein